MKFTLSCRFILFILLVILGAQVQAKSTILVLGDSLSAGYGLQDRESWVSLLQERLKINNSDYAVINASVSGLTSGEGLNKLPDLVKTYKPKILIVALGCNDGLRGNSLILMRNNLADIITTASSDAIKVLLIGFKIPNTYGTAYTEEFANVFVELSKKYDVPLVPFMLNGFATNASYFQIDRLHPTAAAQSKILDNVWTYLQDMLK